jgi:hypothetical protein
MKKLVLSVMMGAMLLSNIVIASAKTVDNNNVSNGTTIVSATDRTIFYPQTEDPDSW